MKRVLLVGFFLVVGSVSVFANTLYVSEVVNITLRTGQGTDHKIIEMIPSGQQVTVLEAGENWTRVATASGNEGWVLTRLLTPETPKGLLLAKLEADYNALQSQVKEPLAEIRRLESENQNLNQQLAETEQKLADLNHSHDALKRKTEVLSKLEAEYSNGQAMLEAMKKENDQLDDTLTQLQQRQIFRWFLAGAGVMLLGFVIGISARPKRRRSSLL